MQEMHEMQGLKTRLKTLHLMHLIASRFSLFLTVILFFNVIYLRRLIKLQYFTHMNYNKVKI